MSPARILVAGIGNIFLGDDGFGPEVIRRVGSHLDAPGVRVVDYGIRGMHLAYDLLDGVDALVLVDALPNRGAPGAVRMFEAGQGPESPDRPPVLDAHGMDPQAVFASLRALGGSPPRTVVVGCEVADVGDGIGLTEPVSAALPDAVRAVGRAVAMLSGISSCA